MPSLRRTFPSVFLAAACANTGSDAPRERTIVADSAGVVVVTNADAGWEREPWRVDPEPLVQIGTVEGDTLQQLYRVRGAARLGDGTIVVANAGTSQLRFYDAGGRFLRAAGGDGEGPGEFGQLFDMRRLAGDSILTMDPRLRRLSLFSPEGRFVSSVRIAEDPGLMFPYLAGVLDDGTRVLRTSRSYTPSTSTTGPTRDSLGLVTVRPDGTLADTVGVFAGMQLYLLSGSDWLSMMAPPFPEQTSVAVGGDLVYVGDTGRYEIRAYDGHGRLLRVVRLARDALPVTADDMEAWREGELRRETPAGPMREARVKAIREMPPPARKPLWTTLQVDAAGNLWVRDYARGPGVPTTWTVFDPEGRLLGPVEVPDRLSVREIGDDYLLGTVRDDLGVEYVRLYRLSRSSEPASAGAARRP